MATALVQLHIQGREQVFAHHSAQDTGYPASRSLRHGPRGPLRGLQGNDHIMNQIFPGQLQLHIRIIDLID